MSIAREISKLRAELPQGALVLVPSERMREELNGESEIRGVLSLLKGGGEIVTQLERELLFYSLLSGTDLVERIFSKEAELKSAARVLAKLYEELALYDVSASDIFEKLQHSADALRWQAIAELFQRYEAECPFLDLPQIKGADIFKREVILFGVHNPSNWTKSVLERIPFRVVSFELPEVSFDSFGRLQSVGAGDEFALRFVSHPREYPPQALVFSNEQELLLLGSESPESPFSSFIESILRANRTQRLVDLLTLSRFSFVEKELQVVMEEEYPLIALDIFQTERLQLGFNLPLTGASQKIECGIKFLKESFVEILTKSSTEVLASASGWAKYFAESEEILEGINKLTTLRLPLAGGAETLSHLLRSISSKKRERLLFSELPALAAGNLFCGFTEGSLPVPSSESTFLSEGVRRLLGLPGREFREMETRYLLKLQQSISGELVIVIPKSDLRGDAAFPSGFVLPAEVNRSATLLKQFFTENEVERPVRGGESPFSLPMIVPPLKKDSYSISEIDLYREAPFKYYLEKVLELEVLTDEANELSPPQFGSLAHRVLERFGRSPLVRSSDPEEIEKYLIKTLRTVVHSYYGENVSGAVHTQFRHLENRLLSFAYTQARLVREGFEVLRVEEEVKGEVAGYGLHGRIDRIDRRGHLLRIIDYKLKEDGAARVFDKQKKIFNSLQLPLYGYLLRGFQFEVLELAYLTLGSEGCEVQAQAVSTEQLELAAEEARELIERILAGEFESEDRLFGAFKILAEVDDED